MCATRRKKEQVGCAKTLVMEPSRGNRVEQDGERQRARERERESPPRFPSRPPMPRRLCGHDVGHHPARHDRTKRGEPERGEHRHPKEARMPSSHDRHERKDRTDDRRPDHFPIERTNTIEKSGHDFPPEASVFGAEVKEHYFVGRRGRALHRTKCTCMAVEYLVPLTSSSPAGRGEKRKL